MKRLEFLNKARALAQQQCEDSSCLTEKEFANIKKSVEEVELYKKAHEILTDASSDIEIALEEVIAQNES